MTGASMTGASMTGASMTEDPEIIRLNISHYQALLKVHSTAYTHEQVRKLLSEAERQLITAMAERAP